MSHQRTITQEFLREWLHYDPTTGLFVWRVTRAHNATAGSRAGSLQQKGYRVIALRGRVYREHRLVWLYVHGSWPEKEIDHVNGVRHDNRIANLRSVTGSVNCQNKKRARRDNKLGLLGVWQRRSRFVASIWVCGASKHIGMFDTAEEAHVAYLKAKRQLHEGNTL